MGPEITSFSADGLEGYCSNGMLDPRILHLLGVQVLSCGSGHAEVESMETRLVALISSTLPSLEEALWGGVMLLHSWRRPDMLGVQAHSQLCNLCWWAWYFLASSIALGPSVPIASHGTADSNYDSRLKSHTNPRHQRRQPHFLGTI